MKIENGGKYQVKLVPANCHREEIVFEIISALDHLNTITDEIFTSLRKRINEHGTQVSSLTARISAAADQVLQHKTTSRAIQILSPAKFPEASDPLPQLFPILHLNSIGEQKMMTDSEELMSRIKSQRILYESPVKHTDELLEYYRVRDFNYSKGSNLGQLGMQHEVGIGNPPPELDIVDSFFLFNSAENPYQNYTISERVGASSSSKIARRVEIAKEVNGKLEATVRDDPTEKRVDNQELDDFYYYPSSVQIPCIDVPDHLPDLPGLSDTLNFGSIETAPPVFSFQRPVPIKPVAGLASVPTSTVTVQEKIAKVEISPAKPNTIISSTSFIPPPPPLPPPGFFVSPAAVITEVAQNSSKSTPIPPPLPPQEIPKLTIPGSKPSTIRKVETEDLRSSLMAAIRDAAGKSKLKSGKEMRSESRKKKQDDVVAEDGGSGGGDLMADLKNSLAMRRRGISGMNDSRKPGLGDIMQKMASSIPMAEDDSLESAKGGNLSDEDDWD